MSYVNSVPGIANGTCVSFWKPKVDNKRECKEDGTWESTTNECVKETDIFKIDFSQLKIEIESTNNTRISGNLLIHDLLECKSPFAPSTIYIRYCYSPYKDKCDTYYYNYVDKYYTYCFSNNILIIPIYKTYVNILNPFTNNLVVLIYKDSNMRVNELYGTDYRSIYFYLYLNSIDL